MSAFKHSFLNKCVLLSILVFAAEGLSAQNTDRASNEQLLNQYVKSKGSEIITFDASNIKQFWIEKNVANIDGTIKIIPIFRDSAFDNQPLKIQLANVNETMDCRVDIIAETKDVKYQILNNASKVLSSSQDENGFLDYSVTSSEFHLEDTPTYSFSIKFLSNTEEPISIKKIVLSFSKNNVSSFLVSPGVLKITGDAVNPQSPITGITAKISDVKDNSFSVTEINTAVFSSKKIYVSDNTISSSVTIKNTGESTAVVYFGYDVYGKDLSSLKGGNFPFGNNKAVNVVSAPAGSHTMIVDAYSIWQKGCFVALNAKDDLSDLPNSTFLDGRIVEIKKLKNDQAEIVLDKPLLSELKPGTKIRVHGVSGAFLYMQVKKMEPGEEETFTGTIKKDDSFLAYSSKAFPRGTYYVIPFILSYSADPKVKNTVLIRDFTVSY